MYGGRWANGPCASNKFYNMGPTTKVTWIHQITSWKSSCRTGLSYRLNAIIADTVEGRITGTKTVLYLLCRYRNRENLSTPCICDIVNHQGTQYLLKYKQSIN